MKWTVIDSVSVTVHKDGRSSVTEHEIDKRFIVVNSTHVAYSVDSIPGVIPGNSDVYPYEMEFNLTIMIGGEGPAGVIIFSSFMGTILLISVCWKCLRAPQPEIDPPFFGTLTLDDLMV
jgi:hypothetical protein